jgi:hypothetical protein
MATFPMAVNDEAAPVGPRPHARLGLGLSIRASVAKRRDREYPGPFGVAIAAAVPLLFIIMSAAPVLADGIPSYTLGQVEPDRFYPSLFESRQLARVEVVNDTHERIDLFLSVYSLEPGDNLTIMVPLRTLPVDVSGLPMKETEFRDRYLIDRAESEVVRQDPAEAWARLRDKTGRALQFAFGSMLLTMPGEYIRENAHLVADDTESMGKAGAGEDVVLNAKPEPVQHYEFDGFSIDVFGVGAGPALGDYLAQKGLAMPEQGELERYEAQYIAVVDGETRPPINATEFDLLLRGAPNTTAKLAQQLRDDPVRDASEIDDLRWELAYEAGEEYAVMAGEDYLRPLRNDLRDYMGDLVDAVFGSTDFAGEVLTVDLPLDGGKAFFPLGTSAGWPNEVGDIDVLFTVPEGKDLDLQGSRDAFVAGRHCYLFQMKNANPGFDLESEVMAGSEDRAAEASRAGFLYDGAVGIAIIIAVVLLIITWLAVALLARRWLRAEGRALRDPTSWFLLVLSLAISLPGALLVYLWARPVPMGRLRASVRTVTPLLVWPVSLALLIVGVLL